jgi:hypothetical protein
MHEAETNFPIIRSNSKSISMGRYLSQPRIILKMEPNPKKRTLHSFFAPAAKKSRVETKVDENDEGNQSQNPVSLLIGANAKK